MSHVLPVGTYKKGNAACRVGPVNGGAGGARVRLHRAHRRPARWCSHAMCRQRRPNGLSPSDRHLHTRTRSVFAPAASPHCCVCRLDCGARSRRAVWRYVWLTMCLAPTGIPAYACMHCQYVACMHACVYALYVCVCAHVCIYVYLWIYMHTF